MRQQAWLAALIVGTGLLLLTILARQIRTAQADYANDLSRAPNEPPAYTSTSTTTPGPPPVACTGLNPVTNPSIAGGNSHLHGVAAVTANNIWAVGSYQGTVNQTLVEHWDGTAWSVVPSPNVGTEDNFLNGLAVVAASDIWAVGYSGPYTAEQTLVEHWDGIAWSVVPSPNVGGNGHLNGVAEVTANNIWAVGYTGPYTAEQTLVEHWDGTTWTVVPSPNSGMGNNFLNGVAAVAANDIWAVGYSGQTLIEHWNGSSWSVVPSPDPGLCSGGSLTDVALVAPNDVWAVGGYVSSCYRCIITRQALIEHWDGTAWSIVPSPNSDTGGDGLDAIAVVAAHDVWAVGASLGENGYEQTLVEHWDGTAWTVVPSPNSGTGSNSLGAIAVVAAHDVWAVGGVVEHWDGTTWAVVPSPNPGKSSNSLNGVAAAATNDIWAVGSYNNGFVAKTLVEHWDGTAWTVVPSPNSGNGGGSLQSVAVVAANDVWAVGNAGGETLAEHWDGTAWSIVPSSGGGYLRASYLNGVAAVAANDVWAVGYSLIPVSPCYFTQQALIEHWNGTAWGDVPSPDSVPLNGIAAVAANDVWAVGSGIMHWDGTAWSIVPSPNPGSGFIRFTGVAAVAANDVWAAGVYYNGTVNQTLVEHWNGTAWAIVPSPNIGTEENFLNGLAVVATNDIWAVGYYRFHGQQQILVEHWDGTAWSVIPSRNAGNGYNYLNSVVAVAANDVWAVGSYLNGSLQEALLEHTGFSDVYPTDYFYTPVTYLACRGVISGYADGTFRPYNNTTRAQMVKITVLGFTKPIITPPGGHYTFEDVPPANPFFAYVETAAADGIVSGYNCGSPGEPCDPQHRPYFRPAANVTRGQLSKITVAAAGWPEITSPVATFADVLPGTTFYRFVETAACHRIISGYTCGGPGEPCDPLHRPYFRQTNNATRGQIAKIVYAAITNSGSCAVPTPVPLTGTPTATGTASPSATSPPGAPAATTTRILGVR